MDGARSRGACVGRIDEGAEADPGVVKRILLSFALSSLGCAVSRLRETASPAAPSSAGPATAGGETTNPQPLVSMDKSRVEVEGLPKSCMPSVGLTGFILE